MGFASNLRRERTQRDLSQQALASAAGVSLTTVSRLETGKHDPRLEVAGRLAGALGIPLADLVSESGPGEAA